MKFNLLEKIFNFLKKKSNSDIIEKCQYIIDRDCEIIKESQQYIKKLNCFCQLTNGLDCNKLFIDVLNVAKKIHDLAVEKEFISLKRIEEYHLHYTEHFINAFEVILEPLYPKKEIDEKLKSDFILKQPHKNKIDKESKQTNIDNYNPYLIIDELKYLCKDGLLKEPSGSLIDNYISHVNNVFNFQHNVEKKLKIDNKTEKFFYKIKYLGDSDIDNYPIFEENYKIITNKDKISKLNKSIIFKLDIDNITKIVLKDVSNIKR